MNTANIGKKPAPESVDTQPTEQDAETLLADAAWAKWSGEAIAKACAVSAMTVSRIRAELAISNNVRDTPTTRTVERNGQTYRRSLTENLSDKPAERIWFNLTSRHDS